MGSRGALTGFTSGSGFCSSEVRGEVDPRSSL